MNSVQTTNVSSLLNISAHDLLKKLPRDVIDHLIKTGRRNIYLIEFGGSSDLDEPIAYYPNLSLDELPLKIINDAKLAGSGLFHLLLKQNQPKIEQNEYFKTILEQLSDLDEIPVNFIQELYLTVLKNPKQILIDMEQIYRHGLGYFYCFDDDSYFKNLRKELTNSCPYNRTFEQLMKKITRESDEN